MMTRDRRRSSIEHCVPDFGRSTALDSESTESELTLTNAMLEFDTGDRDGGVAEDLEAMPLSPRPHGGSGIQAGPCQIDEPSGGDEPPECRLVQGKLASSQHLG